MSALPDRFWETLPLGPGVKVIGHDANGLGALDKPVGVLSHPNDTEKQIRALLAADYDFAAECFRWPGSDGVARALWLLNRLDSPTSGVILVAADGELAADVKAQFQRQAITKSYVALVFGNPRATQEVWRDRLAVEKRDGVVRSSVSAGRIPAESGCRVLRAVRGAAPRALLELTPLTGRTHQLRVQCARRGLPIVGDQTYGDFRLNRAFTKSTRQKRLFLHSLATEVNYHWKGRAWRFAARSPLPAEFEAALEG